MSRGIDLTNPANMKTDSPEPKPRYKTTMPMGLLRFNMSAIFTVGNMTIWKGMTMLNTNR